MVLVLDINKVLTTADIRSIELTDLNSVDPNFISGVSKLVVVDRQQRLVKVLKGQAADLSSIMPLSNLSDVVLT